MTPKELLERMTGIEDEFILSAAEEKSYKRSTARYVRIAASLAACLGIAVGGVALGVHYMRQEPAIPPVTDPVGSAGTDSAGTETAETETAETDTPGTDTGEVPKYNEEDFVIDEEGRLLAYTGDDTEVYIPETVTEITADAFEENEAAESIIKVHISSSVRHIDEKAFAKLSSVEEFEVDEDNEEYVSENGIVATKDGTLYFSPGVNNADVTEFEKTLSFVLEQKKECTVQVAVGLGKLNLDVIQSKDGKEYYACLTSVIAFGITYDLDEGISLRDTANVAFLQTLDTFMLYRGQELGGLNTAGTTWVFTDQGMYKISPSTYSEETDVAPYNRQVLVPTGEVSEKGFGYALFPEKYRYDEHDWSKFLVYCLDPREIAREEGYMTFKNGEIRIDLEKNYSVMDLLSIEPLLIRAKEPENFEYFKETYGWEEDYDFFDVLESNKQRLEPLEPYTSYRKLNYHFYPAVESKISYDLTEDTVTILDPTEFLEEKYNAAVNELVMNYDKYKDISYIVIGDTKLEVELEKSDVSAYGSDETSYYCNLRIVSIESHGHRYVFGKDGYYDRLAMRDYNGKDSYSFSNAIMTEEAFMLEYYPTVSSSYPNVLLFTDSGISDANTAVEENYDETKAYYYYAYDYDDANERITYNRIATKYYSMQSLYKVIEKCVARDEFAYEEGYIEIENGEIIYYPEVVKTISDIADPEAAFEESLHNSKNELTDGYNVPQFDTLDEYLAYNATIYERAY